MRHLVFPSLAEAQAFSRAEARRRCPNAPGDVTLYWWAVIPYPDDRAAIGVGDDTSGLTQAQIAALIPGFDDLSGDEMLLDDDVNVKVSGS